jgi:hypothetical protein
MKRDDGSAREEDDLMKSFSAWGDAASGTEWVDGQDLNPCTGDPCRTVTRLREIASHNGCCSTLCGADTTWEIVIPAPFPDVRLVTKLPRGRRAGSCSSSLEEHLERLRETYVDGPADIVIEIVSSESGPRDRGEKFYEYEAAGVYEYWLIDPGRHQAEFYRLDSEGHYQWVLPDPTGVFRSEALPDFSLKIEWLWQESRPSLMAILRELRLL